MFFSIIIFPLFGICGGSLFGRFLGLGVCYISTFFIFLSFTYSLYLLFIIILTGNVYVLTVSNWINVDYFQLNWSFCCDSLTAIMLVVVTLISSFVHLYSCEYMENDPHLLRFMSYLSLFTFFMLILVTANNFIQMFVGWEGVGLSSYLLINFWFTRIQANKSAIKAMLVNRIGDFALLIALFTIYFTFKTLDYNIIFNLVSSFVNYKISFGIFNVLVIDVICIFLFLGAMGKSAQLGLHTWLPDAMEGPTPVSALIHAATMVTAGIFLISRCSYIFEYSSFSLNFIIIIGCLTAFFGSTTGLFQNDIKKVIAYSTCSQLGYMIFSCGLSSYDVGLFHLANHAIFKALLFLSAGSIIHSLNDEQDMRKMGGLSLLLPFSYSVVLIGSLALMGFPFLTGFYSKDIILEVSFAKYTIFSHFSYILGSLGAFCTAFYSIRLIFLIFLSAPNGNKLIVLKSHEANWKMGLPLLSLCILTVIIGFCGKDLFIGFGSDFWGTSLFILSKNYVLLDIEFLNIFYKLIPFIATVLGAFLSYDLYKNNIFFLYKLKQNSTFISLYTFFNKKWYFDRMYNEFLNTNVLKLSYAFCYQTIDRGILEKFGPLSIAKIIYSSVNSIKVFQTGFIFNYLLYIYLILILSLFFLNISNKYIFFLIFIFILINIKKSLNN